VSAYSKLNEFAEYLAQTELSSVIQNVSWIIPTVQTIHIVSVAIVVSATLLTSLRILGFFERNVPIAAVAHRFLPWTWFALVVLLVTGSILIVGEPGRSLMNPVFGLKMLMLLVVASLTTVLQRPLASEVGFWDASGQRRVVARSIAVVSLALWSCIVFAGRWIAYAGSV
jgi:uncharacterized membrane protein